MAGRTSTDARKARRDARDNRKQSGTQQTQMQQMDSLYNRSRAEYQQQSKPNLRTYEQPGQIAGKLKNAAKQSKAQDQWQAQFEAGRRKLEEEQKKRQQQKRTNLNTKTGMLKK